MQDGIYDEFAELVTALVNKMKLGNGLDSSTTFGPLISQAGLDRVSRSSGEQN